MKKLLICAMALLCVLPLSAKKRQVAIVAHRGYWQCEAGGNSHNSIASLKAAQAGKFWGSEFDVNMTKDGELMVFGSPEFPYGLQVFFDEGAGMENLRAMMLVNAVKDFVEETQYDFFPADVQLNPETATFIIDNGFFLRFKTDGDRAEAMPAVRETGSVREYQPFDFTPGIEAQEAAAPIELKFDE